MPPYARPQSKLVLKAEASFDPISQLVTTRAELATLQERYDALRADRDRLIVTLEANMKKYRRFKRWIFTTKTKVPLTTTPKDKDQVEHYGTGSTTAPQQPAAIKMLETPITSRKPRSMRADAGRSPLKYTSPRRIPLSPSRRILNTPRKMRISSEGSTGHLKSPCDENEDTVVNMSQTQEDSQALTFWQPSTPSQRERASSLTVSSSSPTPKRSLSLQSPPPTKRPRRCVEPVPEPNLTSHQITSRYEHTRSVQPSAINAEFEIDPAANAGVPFAFDEVVRGRRHRHALNAGECEECHGWYTAVGPLPPRLEAPRWNSPTRVVSESPPHGDDDSEGGGSTSVDRKSVSAAVSAHRQVVSRHRAQWDRAPTPPGYWEIGFPDTQAVESINEKAAEMHRQRRAAVAKEARKEGGRYRRRT